MAKKKFDELMKRWLTNQATEPERAKIEAWLDTMKTENTDDLELTDEEADILYNKIVSKESNIREIEAFRPASLKKKNSSRWTFRIAASLLICVTAAVIIWKVAEQDDKAANADPEKIMLNDGTIAWVRSNSKLSYFENERGRFAELNGEALFEVTKDPTRPFTITFKDVTIRVVGTSFTLKTGDSVQLFVLTGNVNFSSRTDKNGVIVSPNEKATYTTKGIVKSSFDKNTIEAFVGSTTYNMNFSNAMFGDVIDRLEKKFDVTFTIPEDLEKCHVNFDITDHSLDSSLTMISSVLNVEYKITGKSVVLTGTGCQ